MTDKIDHAEWYLVACKPKQELRAKEHLINQGAQVLLPMVQVERKLKGRLQQREEVLFPGYLFVCLTAQHGLWGTMRSTRGVRDFVRFNKTPAKIPKNIIKSLEHAANDQPLMISTVPQQGTKLTIEDGPFQGLEAVFHIMDGSERAIVLLNVLGKEQKLSIDINHLANF